MPKVLSYTPEWLSRPSPGYHLFAPKQTTGNGVAARKKDLGPRKTLATRGSELFVASGHEIRWTDLVNLKEGTEPASRTLKISVPLPITRLVISPGGDYLAVSTSHTVHVVILPSSSELEAGDGPLKPKTFQVGPTAHVTEESPVTTTLWHPLGYHGRCLVTVTKAGVVRLWEINRADRSTFSEPALSIDLAKLANAENDGDDLSASQFGVSKGFSPDSVELEVASACFGDSPDQEGVHGWAPMTLWIATVPGDVYALCPLLPSKWQLVESPGAFTFLQTLTSSIHINYSDISDLADAPKYELKTSEKQVEWLADITYEERFIEETPYGESVQVFARPTSAPAVPLLQGPFTITPEVDDFELSDMIVYSLKTMSDSSEDEAAEGIPAAVVCLLTDTCKVHVCLDLQGIAGQWLPASEDEFDMADLAEHDLVIAETITLVESDQSSFNQSITSDIHTDFTFFVSHASGVFYVSLEPWIRKLENELSQPQAQGAEFRMERLLESANSTIEKHLPRKTSSSFAEEEVTSAAILEDGNIGYMLLTSVDGEPQAVFLDAPEYGQPTELDFSKWMNFNVPPTEVRLAWQPPKAFYEPVDLLSSINVPARHKADMKEEVRLSQSTLELLINIHRVLSAKTSHLQLAVADLFNRATRLQEEFKDQVWRTSQVTSKIDAVTGNDEKESGDGSAHGAAKIDERLDKVRSRQAQMNARYEALRRKMDRVNPSDLSEKEAGFVEELSTMDSAVDSSNTTLTGDIDGSQVPAWQRMDKLKKTQKELAKQVERTRDDATSKETSARSSNMAVPSHSRKAENEHIQEMLARNAALVEAATQRLRTLGVAIPLEGES